MRPSFSSFLSCCSSSFSSNSSFLLNALIRSSSDRLGLSILLSVSTISCWVCSICSSKDISFSASVGSICSSPEVTDIELSVLELISSPIFAKNSALLIQTFLKLIQTRIEYPRQILKYRLIFLEHHVNFLFHQTLEDIINLVYLSNAKHV